MHAVLPMFMESENHLSPGVGRPVGKNNFCQGGFPFIIYLYTYYFLTLHLYSLPLNRNRSPINNIKYYLDNSGR